MPFEIFRGKFFFRLLFFMDWNMDFFRVMDRNENFLRVMDVVNVMGHMNLQMDAKIIIIIHI